MAFFSRIAIGCLLAVPLLGAGGQVLATDPEAVNAESACSVTPPRGPFESTLTPAPPLPSADILPSNVGAWTTLITPGSQHRWGSKHGLVESLDGSLVLHGIASAPDGDEVRLNVVVLVDYQPATSAVITAWDADRRERLGRATGSRVDFEAKGKAIAFDIEVPRLTVPIGRYREIQTFVWLEGGRSDARRWTVYAGPHAPPALDCIAASETLPAMPGRTQLDTQGRVVIRAPRAATLAVVPLRKSGPGQVQFIRIDEAKRGWIGQLGEDVDIVAVWEGPYSGPGSGWISSFWSARAAH